MTTSNITVFVNSKQNLVCNMYQCHSCCWYIYTPDIIPNFCNKCGTKFDRVFPDQTREDSAVIVSDKVVQSDT